MDFIVDYWQQLVALVAIGGALFKMRFDLDILKAKVKTLLNYGIRRTTQQNKKLEARIEMLELYSHPPIGWEERIKNLEKSMKKLFNKEK